MKTMKPSNRRKFLLTAGLGTAGVAAAIVTAGKAPLTKAATEVAPASSGYHVTEHIQKYYKTTEV